MPVTTEKPQVGDPAPAATKSLDEVFGESRAYIESLAKEMVRDSGLDDGEPEQAAQPPAPKPAPKPKAKAKVEEEEAESQPEPGAETTTEAAETEEPEASDETQEATSEEEKQDDEVTETDEGEAEPKVEDEEQETGLTPELQRVIDRRIGKEVGKTKAEREAKEALQAQLASVQAELEELRATPSRPAPADPANPLSSVTDARKLEAEKLKAQRALDDAAELLERLEEEPEEVAEVLRRANIPIRDAEGEYSPRGMSKFLRGVRNNASRVLNQHVPARAQFLDLQGAAQAKALELIPKLSDPASQEAKLFRKMVSDAPGRQADPTWPIHTAFELLGVMAMQQAQAAEAKAKAAANGKPKPAPALKIPAKPRSVSATTKPANLDTDAMRMKALTGSQEDRVAYIQKAILEK